MKGKRKRFDADMHKKAQKPKANERICRSFSLKFHIAHKMADNTILSYFVNF